MDFPGGSDGKASAYNAGDPGSFPGLGRSPGEGNGNPLQYFCLENPMDGRACRLHSMGSQNWTQLSDFISLQWLYILLLLCDLKVKVKSLSRVRLFVTPWTVAHQAPPSMEFSRQEYWSGVPFPSPGDLPDPGIEPGSAAS